MEALICRELGDPTLPISDSSPLCLSSDHPIPELSSPTSVRVRVRATSLNYANYLQILGKYQEKFPLPFIPGSDYTGVVESVGAGVRKFKIGDRVCSLASVGSFAAFIVAEESDLYLVPDGCDLVAASALPVAFGTSHVALVHRANLTAGQTRLLEKAPSLSMAGEGGRCGTRMMGVPTSPQGHPANQQAATWVAGDAMDPTKGGGGGGSYVNYCYGAPTSSGGSAFQPRSGNPYVQTSPVANSNAKSTMDTIAGVLNKLGKKIDKGARKAEGYAGNVWQHLKTSPNPADAAMGRIAQGTKALIEGGPDKIFHHTFETFPGEKLQKTFVCYLSTSSGPVIGTLYLSTSRLAFCSDSPLCFSPQPGQQSWSYYKVIVLHEQLASVTPSSNRLNPTEKYIQITTRDGHEFWFMGFVSYDKALHSLTEVLQHSGAFRT